MANGTSGTPRGAMRGVGGAGGAFTITPGANGGVTITPSAQNASQQNFTGAGSGISDTNTHTTYFTPADKAIVSNDNTDGFAIAQRSGLRVPVGYYQTGYYSNVNSELRELGTGRRSRLTPKTQKVVDAMDRNMRPLNNPMRTVRWTSLEALSDNVGMRGASAQQIISKLSKQDYTAVKHDYTSSSWNSSANTVAGKAGRNVKVVMHYSKGALGAFSPTRKEGEFVGARNVAQRFSNARIERTTQRNAVYGNRSGDMLVVDCYVD